MLNLHINLAYLLTTAGDIPTAEQRQLKMDTIG